MSKHKAPTQVTVASIQEKTLFHELVERYWKLGAVLALAGAVAVLVPNYLSKKARLSHHETWDDFETVAGFGGGLFGQIQGGSPEALSVFADQHRESDAVQDQPHGMARSLEVVQQLCRGSRIQSPTSFDLDHHLLLDDLIGAIETNRHLHVAGNARLS